MSQFIPVLRAQPSASQPGEVVRGLLEVPAETCRCRVRQRTDTPRAQGQNTRGAEVRAGFLQEPLGPCESVCDHCSRVPLPWRTPPSHGRPPGKQSWEPHPAPTAETCPGAETCQLVSLVGELHRGDEGLAADKTTSSLTGACGGKPGVPLVTRGAAPPPGRVRGWGDHRSAESRRGLTGLSLCSWLHLRGGRRPEPVRVQPGRGR